MEKWKDVACYESHYEVSCRGRVRAKSRVVANGPNCTRTVRARILKPAFAGKGRYAFVKLSKENAVKQVYVHRLVCEAFCEPANFSPAEVRHLDGDKDNNAAENLAWASHTENMADKFTHGTTARGCKHGNCELAEAQVRAIREDRRPYNEIVRDYGISKPHITRIKQRKVWAWLPD